MIFTSEVTIDLDEKRRIWIQLTADGDGEPSAELIANMTSAATAQALDAYSKAKTQVAQAAQQTFGGNRSPDRPKPMGVN